MISRNSSIAFLAGLTAGAVIALLYAPQSGRRTRRSIQRNIDKAGDNLSEAGEYLREKADRLNRDALKTIEKTRAQVESVLEEASTAVTRTLNDASKAFSKNIDHASAAITSAVGNVTDRF